MARLDWYFDFISPFAYFASLRLEELGEQNDLQLRPVLFAGLLNHWGQKGPAEIPAKRTWTFRWCAWYAQQHGLTMQMPAKHPFNPLPYLRLAEAAGCSQEVIDRIFAAIWTTGADPTDPGRPTELAETLGVDPARIQSTEVKQAIHNNTAAAIDAGVFGVPTLSIDDALFWGVDGMDFAIACLEDPSLLHSDAMRRADDLPAGVQRKQRAQP